MKNNTQENIHCPIDLFSKQEKEIDRLTQTINRAEGAYQKAVHALVLIDVVGVLLECQSYDQENLNCRLCRKFSQLRFETYNLVVKVGQLDESRQRSSENDQ